MLSLESERIFQNLLFAIYSPEDKRKIVQIDDTSTKFRILDPLQIGNDLR